MPLNHNKLVETLRTCDWGAICYWPHNSVYMECGERTNAKETKRKYGITCCINTGRWRALWWQLKLSYRQFALHFRSISIAFFLSLSVCVCRTAHSYAHAHIRCHPLNFYQYNRNWNDPFHLFNRFDSRFGNLKLLKRFKPNMESLPSSDIVIVHGNSYPDLANLIAG